MTSPDPSLNCEIRAGGFLHSVILYRDLSSLHLAKIMIISISKAESSSYLLFLGGTFLGWLAAPLQVPFTSPRAQRDEFLGLRQTRTDSRNSDNSHEGVWSTMDKATTQR